MVTCGALRLHDRVVISLCRVEKRAMRALVLPHGKVAKGNRHALGENGGHKKEVETSRLDEAASIDIYCTRFEPSKRIFTVQG